jgi:hypothetical protein
MDSLLKKRTYIGINITVHIIILFSFLSLFFFLYVSKIEGQAFKSEISDVIQTNMQTTLEKNKSVALPMISQSMPYLEYAKLQVQGPEEASVKQNFFIKFCASFVVLLLIAICLSIMLTLTFDCDKNVPLSEILLENTATFVLVGILEFIFFTKIAIKFVPAPPTLMMKTIISRVKETFQ